MTGTTHRRPVDILLVDDNPGDIRLIKEILKDGKVRSNVTIAQDGEEALARLRKEGVHAESPRPDLVVLDLNLPRLDGQEVLSTIKKDVSLRGIPVVVLTSSNAERDLRNAYDLQASCYIVKPVRLEGFTEVLRAVEYFWLNIVSLCPRTNGDLTCRR